MQPLNVKRNNYLKNPKSSNIKTPLGLCKFLYLLVHKKISSGWILDPCCGDGRLLYYFSERDNRATAGFDVRCKIKKKGVGMFFADDFLKIYDKFSYEVALVICNPPFNQGVGKKLMPDVFLRKIFELYGSDIPVILFSPMGFLLNQRKRSERWHFYRDECDGKITSIISLPLDIFEDVQFHSQILIWNIPDLKTHYWVPEKYLGG